MALLNLFSSKRKNESDTLQTKRESETFTDTRDGKVYKTVKIGKQIWMTDNLAYIPNRGNCWVYDNNKKYVAKYGCFYDWETAKKSIPKGWRLPTKNDFEILLNNYGGEDKKAYKALLTGGNSGFSVKLGGVMVKNGLFGEIGFRTFFWSSTGDRAGVYCLDITRRTKKAFINYGHNFNSYIRCIQD